MKKGKSGRKERQIYTVTISKERIREKVGKGQKTKKTNDSREEKEKNREKGKKKT